jgi:hypothetical protein
VHVPESDVRGITEFFGVANHTKILDKVADIMSILKRIEPYTGSSIRDIPQEIQDLLTANQNNLIDPFLGMADTGNMLLRWRGAKLNDRQRRAFPDGIRIKNWKTIKELHDDVSRQANKLSALERQKMMPWGDDFHALHGARCGDVRILLPRTNQTLVRWGRAQRHCVGSMYNESMQIGACVIAGVFVGGRLEYCARLVKRVVNVSEQRARACPDGEEPVTWAADVGWEPDASDGAPYVWELKEFRGEGNRWPEARHAALAVRALEAHGVEIGGWSDSGNGFGATKSMEWPDSFNVELTVAPGTTRVMKAVKNFAKKET